MRHSAITGLPRAQCVNLFPSVEGFAGSPTTMTSAVNRTDKLVADLRYGFFTSAER
jgi:hypothetical protein